MHQQPRRGGDDASDKLSLVAVPTIPQEQVSSATASRVWVAARARLALRFCHDPAWLVLVLLGVVAFYVQSYRQDLEHNWLALRHVWAALIPAIYATVMTVLGAILRELLPSGEGHRLPIAIGVLFSVASIFFALGYAWQEAWVALVGDDVRPVSRDDIYLVAAVATIISVYGTFARRS